MALFAEIRRRNVLKVALLYVVAGWLILRIADVGVTSHGWPEWVEKFLLLLVAVGFPVALSFAWFYEITPSGLKKAVDVDQTQSIVYKTGQKLNAAVAVLLVLGLAAVIADFFLPDFEFLIPEPEQGDPPISPSAPDEIRSHTLANGLRIIVWPDHDIPNVVMYNFVRAGSRNEYPGITGLSHFFEHMMFNGTSKREQGQFDREMTAAGGDNNAYTTNDITVYMDWFPRTALKIVFDLEADRLGHLRIDPEVVETERGAVASERRLRVDNNNVLRLLEQMRATAFVAHPYQFPVIGWPSDIESWTQDDLISFYKTYYAPNNCTLVITGDVNAAEIFKLAEDYFGAIPAQKPPASVRTVEPEQKGPRRLLIETDAQTPLLHMAFHAGSATDPETLPMSVLLNILVGGDSSRLHRILVEEEQLAISVGGFQDEGFDPGLVYFYATLPPDGDPAAVEARMLEELTRIAVEGVSAEEFAKARNIILADFWRGLATIRGKASALGNFEIFNGSFEKLFELPDDVKAVTVDELKDAAAKVFRTANMTVGVLRAPAPAEEVEE